jgi:hypothetical protein
VHRDSLVAVGNNGREDEENRGKVARECRQPPHRSSATQVLTLEPKFGEGREESALEAGHESKKRVAASRHDRHGRMRRRVVVLMLFDDFPSVVFAAHKQCATLALHQRPLRKRLEVSRTGV